jgi:hypothetical protein
MRKNQNNNHMPIVSLVAARFCGLGCMINTNHYNVIDCDMTSS